MNSFIEKKLRECLKRKWTRLRKTNKTLAHAQKQYFAKKMHKREIAIEK